MISEKEIKERLLKEAEYIRSKIDETKPNIMAAVANRLESLANAIDLKYFPVSYVSRDDLKRYGIEVDKVTDHQMEELADEMGEYFTEYGGYWDFLEGYADKMPRTPWGRVGYQKLEKDEAACYFRDAGEIWTWEVNSKDGQGEIGHVTTQEAFDILSAKKKTVFIIESD